MVEYLDFFCYLVRIILNIGNEARFCVTVEILHLNWMSLACRFCKYEYDSVQRYGSKYLRTNTLV